MRNLNKIQNRERQSPTLDLRREVDTFIDDHGFYILLVRQTPTGTRVERHRVISFSASIPETLPRMLRQAQVGLLSSDAKVVYFKHDAIINQTDWIFEAEFDKFGRVIDIGRMFKINFVDKFREHQGRVEYVTASCDRELANGPDVDLKKVKYVVVD